MVALPYTSSSLQARIVYHGSISPVWGCITLARGPWPTRTIAWGEEDSWIPGGILPVVLYSVCGCRQELPLSPCCPPYRTAHRPVDKGLSCGVRRSGERAQAVPLAYGQIAPPPPGRPGWWALTWHQLAPGVRVLSSMTSSIRRVPSMLQRWSRLGCKEDVTKARDPVTHQRDRDGGDEVLRSGVVWGLCACEPSAFTGMTRPHSTIGYPSPPTHRTTQNSILFPFY